MQNPVYTPPKQPEYRSQKSTRTQIPEQAACKQGGGISHTNISAAHAKP